jgi:pre-rRNA-processing protein IPI3
MYRLVSPCVSTLTTWRFLFLCDPQKQLVRRITAHHKAVRCLGLTDDLSFLLSGGDDAVLSVWPVVDLVDVDDTSDAAVREFHSWTDHLLGVTSVHVGRGGVQARVFSASLDRTARIFEIFSRQLLYTVSCGTFLTSVVASPDEAWLFLGMGDGAITAVDLLTAAAQTFASGGDVVMETGQTRSHMTGHSQAITGFVFVEHATMLISASEDGTVRVWDLQSKQCVNTTDMKSPVTCIARAEYFDPMMLSAAKATPERNFVPIPPLRKYVTNRSSGGAAGGSL